MRYDFFAKSNDECEIESSSRLVVCVLFCALSPPNFCMSWAEIERPQETQNRRLKLIGSPQWGQGIAVMVPVIEN